AAGLAIGVGPAVQRPVTIGLDAAENLLVVWLDWRDQANSAEDLWGQLVTAMGTVSAPAPLLPGLALALTSANPSPGDVRGEFALGSRGHVRLDVHDVSGRRIARIVDEDAEPGPHRFAWDARDDSGAKVPAGLYFVSLRSAEGGRSRTIVIAR